MAAKYIFVTGGVVSSLGKGITAASLGRIMKDRGYTVSMQKFDPYININPGNMSPYQHGEVFVTEDGGECDLDIGHYERFIDENLTVDSDITTGGIYQTVINNERNGAYHGGTVQVIPHITNEIKKRVYRLGSGANAPDLVIVEVGGTVGDIESLPFLEAIRQIKWEAGPENCLIIHVALVPYLTKSHEHKTKPTQHSVKELRSIGIAPDIIVCRAEQPVPKSVRDKISLFCNVEPEAVISNPDVDAIYEIPLMLEREGLGALVTRKFKLPQTQEPIHAEWENCLARMLAPNHKAIIALVGKYVELRDAYISLSEALTHAGAAHGTGIELRWIAAHELHHAQECREKFQEVDAIIVPGGFGERGTEGKILAAQYARENNIPFLGIGLGMQMAVLEFVRNVCGLAGAESTERVPGTEDAVIDLMEEIKERHGNTMRLGAYACQLKDGSLAQAMYGQKEIKERHRHRYEVNNSYCELLERHGMVISGINPELKLVEIVEIPTHDWYFGVQFNAEFKSRPNRPHPLFLCLIQKILERQGGR